MTAMLAVDDLRIRATGGTIVHGVSFEVDEGGVLVLLGESGSGKSLVAQAILGALAPGLEATGTIALGGERVPAERPLARRAWWGRRLALLPQEPWSALDPTMRVGRQLSETHCHVRGLERVAAEEATARDLDTLGLAGAGRAFPHQLSGGMAQRAAFAIARAGGAPVLVVDEPTKGLDAVHKASLVAELRSVPAQGGALVVVTHDVGVARALGGRATVLLDGCVVEEGETQALLDAPGHRYTRALVDAAPSAWPAFAQARSGSTVLAARGLSKRFGARPLFDGLDLDVAAGERLAITGASGSGKSTLGNVLLGLVAPDRGRVERAAGRPPIAFQKLYQDPGSAFAPTLTLRQSLRHLADRHRLPWGIVASLLERMRLDEPLLDRGQSELSGGELQRLALVRVLALRPAFVFADEPTSRLDPVLQREVIGLLVESAGEAGAALVLVTHDPAIADKVASRLLSL